MDDPYDLARFVRAQDAGGTYARALAELRAGEKRTHWMWFVFPQLAGLGSSEMARRYAITGLEEARAYLAHPVLGPRLAEAVAAMLGVEAGRSAHDVLGSPDDLKLRSCLTLFARAAGAEGGVFGAALGRLYGGAEDAGTVGLLGV